MSKRKDILKSTDHLYYILKSQKAKRWVGLMSIKIDLKYVKQLLECIESHNDDELLTKSYWISCVVIYGKCFTDAAKGRGTTLNKDEVFTANPKLEQFHDELMDMRHNYIAHAGDSVFEKIEPRIRLAQRGDAFYPHLVYQGYTVKGFDKNVTTAFSEIVVYLLEQLEHKISKVGKLVLEEEATSKTENDMLEAIRLQRMNDLE